MTDIDVGRLMAQVEYLRDQMKTAQIDITDTLKNKRDIENNLRDISLSLDRLAEHMDSITSRLSAIEDIVDKHISNDIKPQDYVVSKVGKWALSVGALALGAIIMELINRFKGYLFR